MQSRISLLIASLMLAPSLRSQLVTFDSSLPSPDGMYVCSSTNTYPNSCLVRDLTLRDFTQSGEPPSPGNSEVVEFGLLADLQLSVNGGVTFTPATAFGTCTLRVSNSGAQGNGEFYETEIQGLNIAGLLPGMTLRESPTLASFGPTTITDLGDEFLRIDSSFDMFTELSLDGGATWIPALGSARLILAGTEPRIVSQPLSQSVNAGRNVTFCVFARGMRPLSYQWQFNGTDIAGATNRCYARSNSQLADAGNYSVVVTNDSGSVTSAVARLSVNALRLDWFTIDCGGGRSANGTLTVSGTVGQPDAGRPSGGTLAIEGGFWGGPTAVQMPGAPLLTITRTPTNTVVVSWPFPSTGFGLQQNPDLNTANWVTAPENVNVSEDGTTKFIVVNPPVGNRLYRLFKP